MQATNVDRTILVAEDNDINRKVIELQLRLIGFESELVSNGRLALERWRNRRFALVLTDLHMPELDGYQLTQMIRAEEQRRPRTPIIALTANAQRDQAVRCRAAGMDAYLIKPVTLARLKAEILACMLPVADGVVDCAGEPPGPRADAAADLNVLVALIGNDAEVIADVLLSYRRGSADAAQAVRQALASGVMADLTQATHQLRSAALTIGAAQLHRICIDMEAVIARGDLKALEPLAPRFFSEIDAVERFLDSA